MSNLIIADTSSLIALDKINLLELLKILYNEIYITPEVFDEYKTNLPNWITIKRVIDIDKIRELNIGLDIGEASSIALAIENSGSTLIIDEKKGRKIARQLNIKIIGILGIIIKAKDRGVLKEAKTYFLKLREKGFRYSKDLEMKMLKRVGE